MDLNLLSPSEFQTLCWRLIQREHPEALPLNMGSWDGGRDIVSIDSSEHRDFVFQCKTMRDTRFADLKRAVQQSLRSLSPATPIGRWTLCLSKDPTGRFVDWLRIELSEYPFIRDWQVWGQSEITRRLEMQEDILQSTFLHQYLAWRERFPIDDLELIDLGLATEAGWQSCGQGTLRFAQCVGSNSDLVLDVTVRNRGTLAVLLRHIVVEACDVRRHFRGLPGDGLLHRQVTYSASLGSGKPGARPTRLDPALEVAAGAHARFALRLYDTGYAWSGSVRVHLGYSKNKQLLLPWMHLRA